jgi:hypothetical protein
VRVVFLGSFVSFRLGNPFQWGLNILGTDGVPPSKGVASDCVPTLGLVHASGTARAVRFLMGRGFRSIAARFVSDCVPTLGLVHTSGKSQAVRFLMTRGLVPLAKRKPRLLLQYGCGEMVIVACATPSRWCPNSLAIERWVAPFAWTTSPTAPAWVA